MQCLSYAFQLGAELDQKAFDCIQPRAKLSDLLPVHSAPSIARSQAFVLNPMPNSTIAMDGGYVSVATERGASGLVAEKAGQSIWCFTLRVRLRAFVADQKFGDGARDVVHPTDLSGATEKPTAGATHRRVMRIRTTLAKAKGRPSTRVYLPTVPLCDRRRFRP